MTPVKAKDDISADPHIMPTPPSSVSPLESSTIATSASSTRPMPTRLTRSTYKRKLAADSEANAAVDEEAQKPKKVARIDSVVLPSSPASVTISATQSTPAATRKRKTRDLELIVEQEAEAVADNAVGASPRPTKKV